MQVCVLKYVYIDHPIPSLQASRDKQNLQKCYYQFISSLVNNNAMEVISSQGQSHDLMYVIMWCHSHRIFTAKWSVRFHCTRSNGVPRSFSKLVYYVTIILAVIQGQKICFGILKKLLECWGERLSYCNVIMIMWCHFDHVISGQSQQVAGFMDYVYKTIIPACFIVPMKSTFDLNDGHTFLVSTDCYIRVDVLL